ncbi:MAG: ABC transporter ATP-binding protein [Ignavibacteriae bacterium]|nr:MAG: ABC transporter ATP-binding protein [Ignavibacteriota bacterium]
MIEIRNLTKSFGTKQVLRGVNLTIDRGRTTVIIGSSGCGKSVLLKHIIGLLKPDSGEVLIDGQDVTKMNEKEIYQIRNRFGFLFQSAALFDSMTVAENIGLGLVENNDLPQAEIDRIVTEKLGLVDLKGIENLKPSELSGGMKKRVGLARALACNPEFILYDEPTTGLDPITSDSIDSLIDSIAQNEKLQVTSIVVTHDIFSVYEVADRVAMMFEGIIHWEGTPSELQTTDDRIVRDFLERADMQKHVARSRKG